MNSFNRSYREKRQYLFDINKFNLIDFDFNGLKKRVYHNVNFSIFSDDYCNADCEFCVAQLRFESRKQMYKKHKISDDYEYLQRLDKVLAIIRPLNPSISITGGEPTKCSRIVDILDLVKKHGFRKRTITTNGSGLLDNIRGKTVLEHLINSGFVHLNISRAHYNDQINQNIMKFENNQYCSNKELSYIIKYALKRGLRPRLSCLLLKAGINNIHEIMNYLDFYNELGIDNVIFRELMDYDMDNMINTEKKAYCIENKIKLNEIWGEFDKYPDRFVPQLNILGYYYYVEIYKYKSIDCVSESADLIKLYEEKEKHKDIVYEMVFHPNGNLNGSWVDNEDVLLRYE
ncbi:UNVERIFIED_CONTAM: 4Fe-4S single cluster protein [Acetivibrio alkalicellulosi]